MRAPFPDVLEHTAQLHRSIFSWGVDSQITQETSGCSSRRRLGRFAAKLWVLQDSEIHMVTEELPKTAV